MIFEVTRTSFGEDIERVEQVCQDKRARMIILTRERTYEVGTLGWWNNTCQTKALESKNHIIIELETLDDLIAFVDSIGEEVVITAPHGSDASIAPYKHTLEIYDGYRE